MIKLTYIKVIVFILFSKTLFSQSSNIESDNQSSQIIILESENLEKREAFRAKSTAKVDDLYNYLNIVGNTNFDNDIRTHTASLVKDLFVDKATLSRDILSSREAPILIDVFLETLINSKEKIEFIISNINLDSNILNYVLTLKTGTKTIDTIEITQTIHWAYKTKQFGKHSKDVLVSSFGSIIAL